MSYKTILPFLLSIFFQNVLQAQFNDLSDDKDLDKRVSKIVDSAIVAQAFPGCTVYASIGDSVIYFKSFGYHTYDSITPTIQSDIYDLASVTKVAAATLALMKLYELGLYELDDPINKYIKGLGWSDVGKASFRSILAHEAGFESWIKYYDEIRKGNGKYKRKTITDHYSEKYPFRVSDGMYLHADFANVIKRYIKRTKVKDDQGYLYSGLFFYLVPELVENLSGMKFETFLSFYFYEPLGAETMVFNPANYFDKNNIVPTELDTFFRNAQIHGVVHDEGAILMKGVSGNAGLFSNATDLGKLGSLWLSAGEFEGQQLLLASTVDLFTTAQYPNHGNRRGLGFDKPLLEYDSLSSSVSRFASERSFGHSGYTGTFIWIDPDADLVFVFLSNRVYPSRSHTQIYKQRVRPRIHDLFYEYLNLNETN